MGNDRVKPEGKAEYTMDNDMSWKLFDDRLGFIPVVLLRARIALWWRMATRPGTLRSFTAGLLEFAGIGLVLAGLYLIHALAFIIGLGALCLLLAQGLTSGRGEE